MNVNSLAERIIQVLVFQPVSEVTKTKQKAIAQFVKSNIKYLKITVPNLATLLMTVCDIHTEYPYSGGNELVENLQMTLFPEYQESINKWSKETITTDEIDSVIKQIKTQIISDKVLSNVDSIQETLDSLANLPSYDMVLKTYKELITKSYIDLVDSIVDESEVDLAEGNINDSINYIVEMAKDQLSVPSGFFNLDKKLHSGGFESGRVYIFGGKPGLGKSALLLNFSANIANLTSKQLKIPSRTKTAVVYITLENDLPETIERLVRNRTGKDLILHELSERERQLVINDVKFNQGLIIKYMKPYETTTTDIFLYLSKLAEKYKLITVLVDHLSLLSSKNRIQERRHDLGHATAELKVAAIKFNIPVIAAMQLNTMGYKGIPTISNLDESRQPAQAADLVALMFEEQYDPNICSPRVQLINGKYIGMNIDKNRNGDKGIIYNLFRGNIFKFSATDYNYVDFHTAQMRENF